MGILDIFRKVPPEQALRSLRHGAVIAALSFRAHTGETNNQLSSNAGAEFLFLVLHIIDVAMFQLLGEEKRAQYFDMLTLDTIREYSVASLKNNEPDEVKSLVSEELLRRFNTRQITFTKCKSLAGEGFPSAGTKLFAMCFFVHRTLGRTERIQFDEILAGTARIQGSDLHDFADIEHIVKWSTYFASAVKSMNIQREVRRLK